MCYSLVLYIFLKLIKVITSGKNDGGQQRTWHWRIRLEDWTSYTERLAQYFVANDIADAGKKRAILLSACGPSTYQLIRNLASPTKPAEKSYDDLVTLVNDHLHPTPTVACQRYNFNTRTQKEGESIAEYVAELRRIAEHCKYDAMLEEMLRDMLNYVWSERSSNEAKTLGGKGPDV